MENLQKIRDGYKSLENFELIYEQDTYEDTLEMVKQYDPLLIIPGTEEGVILATKLSNDLNLLCNPIENLDAMTLKNEMQKRLAENNLRYIKGQTVSTIDEAIDFYEREGLNEVVIKPLYSAGSVGVRICLNKDEMIKAVREVLEQRGYYGNEFDEVLIQERIDGMEYVVNTVSCDGIHRLTTIWKYHKVKTEEGGIVYDYDEIIADLGLGESQLVEYAYDVADAMGLNMGLYMESI
ncbi:MAG: ATP-grasp domain-containing protein [Methanobrevibacter sp.]|nr:ATP-grasp domain-containing protein [Methanobrevibacter sp.]